MESDQGEKWQDIGGDVDQQRNELSVDELPDLEYWPHLDFDPELMHQSLDWLDKVDQPTSSARVDAPNDRDAFVSGLHNSKELAREVIGGEYDRLTGDEPSKEGALSLEPSGDDEPLQVNGREVLNSLMVVILTNACKSCFPPLFYEY